VTDADISGSLEKQQNN